MSILSTFSRDPSCFLVTACYPARDEVRLSSPVRAAFSEFGENLPPQKLFLRWNHALVRGLRCHTGEIVKIIFDNEEPMSEGTIGGTAMSKIKALCGCEDLVKRYECIGVQGVQ